MDATTIINKNLSNIKLVIWDWYETLSDQHLYAGLKAAHPGAFELVQRYFIERNEKIKQWEKGELTYHELHSAFSEITGLPVSVFDNCLGMIKDTVDIDPKIVAAVEKFKELGKIQVIATDNYDIWDEFFLPNYSKYLDNFFTKIYNTNSYRLLKDDETDGFIKQVLADQGVSYGEALLIDDNERFTERFIALGGNALKFNNKSELIQKLSEIT